MVRATGACLQGNFYFLHHFGGFLLDRFHSIVGQLVSRFNCTNDKAISKTQIQPYMTACTGLKVLIIESSTSSCCDADSHIPGFRLKSQQVT